MDGQRPASQKYPAALAGVLNAPEENRDSAYYSGTDASSKHTSTASGMGGLSPHSSSFHTSPVDKTPSPTAPTNLLPGPQPLVSPINSNMSVASMVSPTTPASIDARRFDRPQSLDSAPNSATFMPPHGDMHESYSRRESVDSRMNQGFNDMRLGNSPYATQNPSTTSVHSTLHQQRNPRPDHASFLNNRISNGYQPNVERNPDGHSKMTRVAPAITGPTTSQIARAAEPTKGQAWAFPDENEVTRGLAPVHRESLIDSRRSSIADSIASSQYTTESRLPPGQRRLEDGLTASDFQRLSNASGEFSTVHHHTLQHRQLGDLQSEDGTVHGGSQPYSRTPELRVSHKLAERKRRTEMKELFEQLRDLMPQERGSKASKWEILSKAITEHQKLASTNHHLQQLVNKLQGVEAENDQLRRENQQLRMMNRAAPYQISDADEYARARPAELQPLPPLRTLQPANPPPAPESMTGVQYEPPHRINGYRPDQPPGSRY